MKTFLLCIIMKIPLNYPLISRIITMKSIPTEIRNLSRPGRIKEDPIHNFSDFYPSAFNRDRISIIFNSNQNIQNQK